MPGGHRAPGLPAFGELFDILARHLFTGGVVNMTRGLAAEWAQDGVRVNAIALIYVKTELTAPMPEAWIEDFDRMAPLGGRADPVDIANAALYLSSREAGMVTGHILPVDGGYTAR